MSGWPELDGDVTPWWNRGLKENTVYIILNPRELEQLLRPVDDAVGGNGPLVRELQEKIDKHVGDIEISADLYGRIVRGAAHWQGGHVKALQAVIKAATR